MDKIEKPGEKLFVFNQFDSISRYKSSQYWSFFSNSLILIKKKKKKDINLYFL